MKSGQNCNFWKVCIWNGFEHKLIQNYFLKILAILISCLTVRPRQLIISSNAHVNCHRAAAAFKGGPKSRSNERNERTSKAGRQRVDNCVFILSAFSLAPSCCCCCSASFLRDHGHGWLVSMSEHAASLVDADLAWLISPRIFGAWSRHRDVKGLNERRFFFCNG